ncbi:MAG: hypothetical protein WBB73_16625 [Candidatus Aminicenantaceae bacterium]
MESGFESLRRQQELYRVLDIMQNLSLNILTFFFIGMDQPGHSST